MSEAVQRPASTPERLNPFPGLRPFEPDEDHLFFGRERETDELLARLRGNRFLTVIGTSGSGKSSLVRSGLIPSLYSGFMVQAGSTWRVAIFRPGHDPIGNLAGALAAPEVLGGTGGEGAETDRLLLETTLRASSRGLSECVRQAHLSGDENLLVVVDQFEELFRYRRARRAESADDEAVAFAKLLVDAARRREVPVYVVLTLRSDFIGDCMDYPGLPEAVNEGQYLIPRMTRNELRRAIEGPVAVAGGQIAPRLVTRLLNEVGDDPDQLPVLQHALMRTWDRAAADGDGFTLDLAPYEAIGTMTQALSQHAEEAYAELATPRQRHIAERMFKALTDRGLDERGVRRPTPLREVAEICEVDVSDVFAVVDPFRAPGRTFLMPPSSVQLHADSVIDLSHESLMRCWGRLVDWVDAETAAAKGYLRLCRAAERCERGEAGLWVDPELSLGRQWLKHNRPNAAWARRYDPSFERGMRFLDRSEGEQRRRQAQEESARRAKLRRARIVAAVLGAAALVTVSFGVFALWAQLSASRAQRAATREAAAARQVTDFLVNIFEVSDPEQARGGDVTARELLDQGARRIDAELRDQPLIRARLKRSIGNVYRALGIYDRAEPLLRESLETTRARLANDHPQTLSSLSDLAHLLGWLGKYREMDGLIVEAVEKRRRILGPEHPDTLESLGYLADFHGFMGRYDEAEQIQSSVLEARKRVLGNEHEETLEAMGKLASTYQAQGRFEEGETLLREVLEIEERVLGADHPTTLASAGAMANLLLQAGRYDEAEASAREVLQIRRAVLGDEHPQTLASFEALGNVLRAQGRYQQALSMQEEVLESKRKLLGDEHPSTLQALNAVAVVRYAMGRSDDVESMLVELIEKQRRVLGDEHPETLTNRQNLAVIYGTQGRHEEAESLYREVLEIERRVLGDDHPSTLFVISNLAITLQDQGKSDEAEPYAREALETRRRVLGEDHPETLTSLGWLGELYSRQGRHDDARSISVEVLERHRRKLGPDHPRTLGALGNLAQLDWRQGRYDDALQSLREMLALAENSRGEEDLISLGALQGLALVSDESGDPAAARRYGARLLEVLRRLAEKEDADALARLNYAWTLLLARPDDLRDPGRALPLCRGLLDENRATLPAGHVSIAEAMVCTGLALHGVGRHDEAEPLLRDALALRREALGETNWRVPNTMTLLGAALAGLERFAEAESLMLDGFARLEADSNVSPHQRREAVARIVALYESWGKPEQAAEWRTKLAPRSAG